MAQCMYGGCFAFLFAYVDTLSVWKNIRAVHFTEGIEKRHALITHAGSFFLQLKLS